jgi:tRNA dimethylallyltransferase
MAPLLIAVMGPTASGKTALAESLADRLGAALINSDAFQVYRYLDIGTAKSDRKSEYRLIDIRDPDEPFGVGEWVQLAADELARLWAEGRSAVVVGGTGLNVRALFEGYGEMAPPPPTELREELNTYSLEALCAKLDELDPEAGERVDRKNRVRVQRSVERAMTRADAVRFEVPPFRKIKLAVDRNPEELNERIATRVRQMVEAGWLREVEELKRKGYEEHDPGMRAHGYRHILSALEGKITEAEAMDLTTTEVRRYAKRQRTWLRTEPGVILIDQDDPLPVALREIGFS